ncbi:tryptophanase [Qaidamihabitans albus]|uniref:tryptophanase n=1 Tax=Qaidamihabitans albus TaxID=2795733 RepID=UPI0018F1BE12|nr:tryptophanase [Qaidamihabitans albus]
MKSFPPYRIQVVKEIPITTRQEREEVLARAAYNGFDVPANKVTIDLLTDSGTGAPSAAQEAAAAGADRSYAGSDSYYRFREIVGELTGHPHVLPVHQGRAAERVLFGAVLGPGRISLSNTHFDTTRANVELTGGEARDLPCPEARDLDSLDPFKGNIDLGELERTLAGPDGARVAQVLITITNNGGGGQPVSMANLESVRRMCDRFGVPFFLDAARFAENAWLVTQREPGYEQQTPREVARRTFRMADGCVTSLKKDGIAPMGAFIALRDADLAQRCEANLIATEGFRTYGGLTGHDLERVAQGLREVLDPNYLGARTAETAHLAELINEAGVDTVQPPGIHALYLNAGRLLPHIPAHGFPGHALACELYLAGGIRCAELGSLYLGEFDAAHNLVAPAPFELVRLAIPRRTYTQSHLEYVADVLSAIAKNPEQVPEYRVVDAPPVLRHFNLRMRRLPANR